MTAFNESDCMSTNPFEGDYGDGEVTLRDKICTARKAGPCQLCGGTIQKGERIRTRVEAYERSLQVFRWCSDCCHAFSISWEDSGAEWESRIDAGREAQAACLGMGMKRPSDAFFNRKDPNPPVGETNA